jgi:hypothetical protein
MKITKNNPRKTTLLSINLMEFFNVASPLNVCILTAKNESRLSCEMKIERRKRNLIIIRQEKDEEVKNYIFNIRIIIERRGAEVMVFTEWLPFAK